MADSVTLFRRPFTTLRLFALVLIDFAASAVKQARAHLFTAILVSAAVLGWIYAKDRLPANVVGLQERLSSEVAFATYWIVLGVLSSVGLGSGLHTGLLALIPHVIRVTTTALRLGTTDFSAKIVSYGEWPKKLDLASLSEAISPHYAPDAFDAASGATLAAASALTGHPQPPHTPPSPGHVSFGSIASKVAWAAFLWGLGTALGELPPYFIARAAAASGGALAEELQDVETLEEDLQSSSKGGKGGKSKKRKAGLVERGKVFLYESVQKYGFIAVLLAASIPNPLFDLAGLTCGHFGIPFATFFGATLLGKAVFKVSIQVLFIIATVKYGAAAFEVSREWLSHALPGWGRLHSILDSVERSIHAGQHGLCTNQMAAASREAHSAFAAASSSSSSETAAVTLSSALNTALAKCHSCCTGHFNGAAAERCSVACQSTMEAAALSPALGSANEDAGGGFDASLLGKQAWGLFMVAMVGYFVVSLVNSLAQGKYKEEQQQQQQEGKSKNKKKQGTIAKVEEKEEEEPAAILAAAPPRRVRASSAARQAESARKSPAKKAASKSPARPAAASSAASSASSAKPRRALSSKKAPAQKKRRLEAESESEEEEEGSSSDDEDEDEVPLVVLTDSVVSSAPSRRAAPAPTAAPARGRARAGSSSAAPKNKSPSRGPAAAKPSRSSAAAAAAAPAPKPAAAAASKRGPSQKRVTRAAAAGKK